jgi:hypothetical protein
MYMYAMKQTQGPLYNYLPYLHVYTQVHISYTQVHISYTHVHISYTHVHISYTHVHISSTISM